MKKEKIGDACSRYEMAIHFNAQDKVAYLKLSRVYETINKDRALEYLEKLIALDPDYIPAYAVIGDINRELGRYQTALNAYEKFITIPGVPLLQHERYAQLLYFTKQYDKSVEQIKYVLEQDPNNAVMHRLQAYNNYELGNFEAGHRQIESFLKNSPVEKHIYLDYITYGRLQVELKQYNEALENFRKAVTLVDSTKKTEIYKELISATGKIGDYHEQAKYYEAYFEIEPSPSALDYIYYGLAYYKLASTCISPDALAAVVTPEQGALNAETFGSYIQKGDKAFSEVIVISPNSHQGYVWRANLHALVDVYDQAKKGEMLGDAKPYYEAALEFMNGKNEDGARNNEIIECYRYLASYHAFVAKDNATAGENYKQILRINPEDAQAKQALDVLKIKY
jgi:tetratricopeptide (TPR) repeat protein